MENLCSRSHVGSPTLFSETGSFCDRVLCSLPGQQAAGNSLSLLTPSAKVTDEFCFVFVFNMPDFYVDAGDRNSGPPVCTAERFPSEPAPWLLCLALHVCSLMHFPQDELWLWKSRGLHPLWYLTTQ